LDPTSEEDSQSPHLFKNPASDFLSSRKAHKCRCYLFQFVGKRGERSEKIVHSDGLKYYDGLDFGKDTTNHEYLKGMPIQQPVR
jgi:hypothetical protein